MQIVCKKTDDVPLVCLFMNDRSIQVFSCEIWEIFKNTQFEKHQRTAASDHL